MGVFQFQAKLMAAIIVTFLLVALGGPAHALLRPYGPGKTLALLNAGREGNFGRVSLDSDKGEVLVGFSFRLRSLASKRRLPSPPPAPTRNRKIGTAKAFASPPKTHYLR